MTLRSLSLSEHTSTQLRNLCGAVGLFDADTPVTVLTLLLGTTGARAVAKPPVWASHISDDMTPVEFSIALDEGGSPVLRMLVEAIADEPSLRANNRVALRALDALAERFDLSLDRFRDVWDLFVPDEPHGRFGIWYSVIFRPNAAPDVKVYFNPSARGADLAPALVSEALARLGLEDVYQLVSDHAIQRGELDRFTFFALDLHSRPQSRVKVYVSHHDSGLPVIERAAAGVQGVALDRVREFYSVIGGGADRRLTGLPSLSSYSFTDAEPGAPNNYSLYMPIRDLVSDDEAALERVLVLMNRHGLSPSLLRHALDAVSARRLCDGVGLIAYVSLRMGPTQPGITVYLSSEAYETMPPKSWTSSSVQLPSVNAK